MDLLSIKQYKGLEEAEIVYRCGHRRKVKVPWEVLDSLDDDARQMLCNVCAAKGGKHEAIPKAPSET